MGVESWHEGCVAVVTGGATGIGLEIARTLHRRGAQVVIGSRRLAREGEAVALENELGSRFLTEQLDVRSSDSVAEFSRKVEETFGVPNILVNAAGVTTHQSVEGHVEKDWVEVIDTNLNGPFRMIRSHIGAMKSKGSGRIVNIGSTAARSASSDHAAYCASKAGLLGLTRAVALEGAPYGVTCNCVSPTWVETPMLMESAKRMAEKAQLSQAEQMGELARANPQSRLVQPSEIAEMVSFICSDLAPALTMEDIQINAGAYW